MCCIDFTFLFQGKEQGITVAKLPGIVGNISALVEKAFCFPHIAEALFCIAAVYIA